MHPFLLAALLALVGFLVPAAAHAAPRASELVQAELVAEPRAVEPGRPFTVAVRLRMAEHWHTYWRNPGDSGLASEIAWTLPPGFSAGPIQWPIPSRIPVGHLVNYGYEDEATLLVEIAPPASLPAGAPVRIEARLNYLVCERECIPGEARLETTVPVGASGEGSADPSVGYIFAAARASLPLPFDGRTSLREADGRLALRVEGGGIATGSVASAYFFPAGETAVEHAAEQTLATDADGLTLALRRSPIAAGPAPADIPGVLVVEEKRGDGYLRRGYQIGADAPSAAAGPGASLAAAPVEPARAEVTPRAELTAGGVALAVLLAVLGGLVLNLMPCVFPVLSIKVLHLVEHSGRSPGAVRMAGFAYAAGVVASFLALAALLLALRAGGQEAGWGFQLQSPAFVLALVFVLFAVGLSLSGAVEFGTGVAGRAGAVRERDGLLGSFLTGVLATVVATPCTAPFMGVAVGYAVTAPAGIALVVFAALGLGLAAPFLVLTARPSLIAVLPRPGAWMARLKQVLAFPVYATVAWLLFVLSRQVGPTAFLAALLGLVLLAFGLWCLGLARESDGSGRRLGQGVAAAALAGVVAVGWTVAADQTGLSSVPAQADAGEEGFTQARLDRLRAEGRPVFVNMTAAWCITCLLNERTVLSGEAVRAALAERGVVYLKGDWTNQNPEITRLLERHGRSGVPLYVLYPPGGEGTVLPQILTRSAVLEALDRVPLAAAGPRRTSALSAATPR